MVGSEQNHENTSSKQPVFELHPGSLENVNKSVTRAVMHVVNGVLHARAAAAHWRTLDQSGYGGDWNNTTDPTNNTSRDFTASRLIITVMKMAR
jgi:hypothetical protein